jgi:predicted NodU family carbamoyl transferase
MRVLGISAFYHDSAAALIEDGRIVAAAQEERFTRKKHDSRFPSAAIAYCLEAGGVAAGDIDKVAFYDKPFLKFERLLETYVSFAPRGFASFPHGDAALAAREAVPARPADQGAEKTRARTSTGTSGCCFPSTT